MKRLITLLIAGLLSPAWCQTPYFVGVPRADGSLHDQCMRSVALAHTLGFSGVAMQVGPSYDPANPAIPMAQVKESVDLALSLGLRVNLSFECPPINNFWAPKNGGVKWLELSRPPSGPGNALWTCMGKDRSAYCQVAAQCALDRGLNPALVLNTEDWNEVDKGGASSPKMADGTYEPKYASLRDGEIEGNWFIQALAVTNATDYHGIPSYGLTLEGASGAAQRMEIDSFVIHGGTQTAKRLVSHWVGIGFNDYAPPCSTITALRLACPPKMQAEVDMIHASPILGALQIVNQETNCFAERIPSGQDFGVWRIAALGSLQGVRGCGRLTAFTLCSTNNATVHVALYNQDLTPIGKAFSVAAMTGPVGPTSGGN